MSKDFGVSFIELLIAVVIKYKIGDNQNRLCCGTFRVCKI